MNINEVGPDGLDIGTDGLDDLGQIDSLGSHILMSLVCTTYTYNTVLVEFFLSDSINIFQESFKF